MNLPTGLFGCPDSPCTCGAKNTNGEPTQPSTNTPVIVQIPESTPNLPNSRVETFPTNARPSNNSIQPAEIIATASNSLPVPTISPTMSTAVKLGTCGRAGTFALVGPAVQFVQAIQSGESYALEPRAVLNTANRGKLYSERYLYPPAIISIIPATIAEPAIGARGATALFSTILKECPNCKGSPLITTTETVTNENNERVTLSTDSHSCYPNNPKLSRVKYKS